MTECRGEDDRNTEYERKEKKLFKGLREQMANCTRVFTAWQRVSLVHKDESGKRGGREGAMDGAGQRDQALRACHWATLVRGRASMSFQCFTSPGPLFHDR